LRIAARLALAFRGFTAASVRSSHGAGSPESGVL